MTTILPDQPLVSIVTPSYNQAQFIEETVGSVLSQDYPNVEYSVIDGGSTDGTQEILKRYGERLTWISEKDQGQADAVNKGFRKARGDIFGWLNSDDTYQPGAVRKVVQFFEANPDISMVYGDAYTVDSESRIIDLAPTEDFDYQRLAETCFICQPTVFLRRHVFEQIGPLDVSLHYCLDYDYWMRVGKRFRISYLRELLAASRLHTEAKTFAKRHELHREIISTIQRHYPVVPLRTIYLYSYVSFLEKFMPSIEGLYPNGWATSHVSIHLGDKFNPSTLIVKGRTKRSNNSPLTLKLTCGGRTVERDIPLSGPFSIHERLYAGHEVLLDTKEMNGGSHVSASIETTHPSCTAERPFSYRLARGCRYVIHKLTISDHDGCRKVLFSKRVFLIFSIALPVLIVYNTILINRRLSVRGQLKALVQLFHSIFMRERTGSSAM